MPKKKRKPLARVNNTKALAICLFFSKVNDTFTRHIASCVIPKKNQNHNQLHFFGIRKRIRIVETPLLKKK